MAFGKNSLIFKGTHEIENFVLKFFRKRFCKPSSMWNSFIVDQMGRMLVAKVDSRARDSIMKILTMVIFVANSVHSNTSQVQSKFHGHKRIALPVIKVLISLVSDVGEGDKKLEMLVTLLAFFLQVCIGGCRFCEKAPPSIGAASEAAGDNLFLSQTYFLD